MRNDSNWPGFGPEFNIVNDSPFIGQNQEAGSVFPPVSGNFKLLDGTDFLLLDSSNFLLL